MLRNCKGFTMIEVMITLAIVSIVFGLGYITMAGFLPKQRLTRTATDVENILLRAQAEAFSRSKVTGVQFSVSGGELFIDNSDQPGNNPLTRDGIDNSFITKFNFPADVRLVENSCNPFRVTPSCSLHECTVWFDQTGQAVEVLDDGLGNLSTSPANFQLIVASNKLELGNSAREIEVFSSGLVEIVKLGQVGSALSPLSGPQVFYANQPPVAGVTTNCPP